MIKGNETDVAKVDFESQALWGEKFVCFYSFWTSKNVHISATRCLIEMLFGSKCSILNGQTIYIEKSKFNIANMWLIPIYCVTYVWVIFWLITWNRLFSFHSIWNLSLNRFSILCLYCVDNNITYLKLEKHENSGHIHCALWDITKMQQRKPL